MVKNLSLGDLELILCDWYEMDEQLPNPIFEKKEFERVSNGLWAIGEFRNYVSKQIYPETQTSIKNLREMACTFAKKMEMFASMNKNFRTTMAAVLNAQYHVNRNLSVRGVCPLNEYLSFLGLDEVDGGDVIGWDICYMIEEMDCYWLDFDNHKTTLEDGLECIIIDTMALSKFE